MKLAILTQYYPPEIGAPQARLSALARGIAKRGHDVTVIAAKPNYPTGRIQPGYPGLVARERLDGVSVMRLPIYPTNRSDRVRRLSCYFSFVASSAIAGTLLMESPDYLMVESPPLFLGLTGLWLRRLKGTRLIFNVSDLWPESAVRLGAVAEGSAAHRWSAALEARCYRESWLVTGQTGAIVDDIRGRFPKVRVHHLPNGVDCERFRPDAGTGEGNESGRCTVLYAGLLGLAQDLDQVLNAAALMDGDAGVDFHLAGDGPCRMALAGRVRNENLANVRLVEPRPHAAMPALLAEADVLMVPLHRSFSDAVPSKLYEALASGRPVVVIASGEAARIVADADAGLVVPHDDPPALAAAVRRLAADRGLRTRLGANGRAAALRHYDRAHVVDAFTTLLEQGLESRELR